MVFHSPDAAGSRAASGKETVGRRGYSRRRPIAIYFARAFFSTAASGLPTFCFTAISTAVAGWP